MNNDLISRAAAIEIAMEYCPDDDGSCSKADIDTREMLDELENLPAIDAVEVVRCRDCLNRGMKASIKYYGYRDDMWLCMLHGIAVLPDDYCSGGVKADEEVNGDE